MKTKTITGIYQCLNCGTEIRAERKIIIDQYLDKKLLLPDLKCSCGLRENKILLDITIYDHINRKTKNKKHQQETARS